MRYTKGYKKLADFPLGSILLSQFRNRCEKHKILTARTIHGDGTGHSFVRLYVKPSDMCLSRTILEALQRAATPVRRETNEPPKE